jgi:glutaredoxin 3
MANSPDNASLDNAPIHRVDVYTRFLCPYCVRARRLLKSRGIEFREINVSLDRDADGRMRELSGRTSVPQIFVGDYHIGGCDDLVAADASGELARLVARYEPIDCAIYDELELACVQRSEITVTTDDGVVTGTAHTLRIVDSAEVLVLDRGDAGTHEVRLDRIRDWQRV